ncbi:MAG: UDP-3-O-(3-hydroxymyristoyl)glucosamine N-acyltransferase [Bacteroidales bacterium]|nr:UDP-3-O-(3-hydroxymyristoyl)glucosamine N-acyltransferase [Bacteroidales bacterium]
MKFPQPISVDELVRIIGHPVQRMGCVDGPVTGLNEFHSVEKGDVTFVDNDKYYNRVLESDATVIILDKTNVDCPYGKELLFSEDPLMDYLAIVKHFKRYEPQLVSIHPDAVIGEGTVIEPHVFIGRNVRIGRNCIIHSNVSIYEDTTIGDNVIIHSNTTVGGDACYFQKRPERWIKLESCGSTVIGNDVEVGCNCCIDKGVSGVTYIGDGTKFDNLVQVGHDTHIGKRVLLGAQSGIAGCTYIDDDCKVWAKACVNKDLYIAKNTIVFACSAVDRNVTEEGTTLLGVPAVESAKKWREFAYLRKLSFLFDDVRALKEKMESMENKEGEK